MVEFNEIHSIQIARSPLTLDEVRGEIVESKLVGPTDDGDGRIELKIKVINATTRDWNYVVVRTQFLSDSGQVVEETRDVLEQEILAGDNGDFETFQNVRWPLLGQNPERAGIIVNVPACGVALHEIGQFDVLSEAFKTTPLTPVELPNIARLASGVFWKTEPDNDKDSGVTIRALIQNLTSFHLPEVRLLANVTDKAGREVTDAGGSEELRPGEILLLGGYGYAKDKQFKNSRISLSLRAYYPVAAGILGHVGLEIEDAEDTESDNSDENSGDRRSGDVSVRGLDELEEVKSGGVDAFLIFATNNPDAIIPDEYTEIAFPGSDTAGSLEPPTGFGDKVLTQEQMNKSGGTIAIEEVLPYTVEMRKLLKSRFDLCAIEDGENFKAVDVKQFISAVESGVFKFLRVVHIES